ncbi:uncharacterized protein LOC126741865 [Anthonomus grandis grandis]|uniref:uncharacterized protein LOC126741865 n=1 Tax=Anthonomus grandis grandis TaxID=2921223 RepID=UPI00216607E7|nr:uncharacterized protein LOC126741865 [Anthonomus grandis grandis]
MEQFKRNRKASRSMFTRNSNELEQLLNSEGNITEIKALFELLTAKSDSLKVVDEETYALLLEDDTFQEEDLIKELESQEEYRKRYGLLEIRVNEYLAKKLSVGEGTEKRNSSALASRIEDQH